MKNVVDSVLPQDFCCNCGACAAVCPTGCLEMREQDTGEYRPVLKDATSCSACGLCLDVCPYSGKVAEDEDSLGLALFSEEPEIQQNEATGWFHETFVGAVSDDVLRGKAPSGGLATAMLCELLESGKIDAAVVAKPLPERPWFEPIIATTPDEIRASSGSVYHVMTFAPILREILQGPPRRYAIVALPCVVKSIRLMQKRLPKLAERISYVFSLTCGGCCCLHVPDLVTVMLHESDGGLRYRDKTGSRISQDFRVSTRSTRLTNPRQVKMYGLFGFLWINHVGHLKSCYLCDDLLSELADITFMDAWLPEYMPERRGTNLVISRRRELSEILVRGYSEGRFTGGKIPVQKVVESQQPKWGDRQVTAAAFYDFEKNRRNTESELPVKRQRISTFRMTLNEKERARNRKIVARCIRFHRSTRRYLRFFSHHFSNPSGWFCRLYVWRVYWKILCSLLWNRPFTSKLQSLKNERIE